MASSSSSSYQSWKHDVFLSFRGTDVRNTFVDHLYSVLVQKGIYTYKDDQTLPRGETIGPSLLKAIEESHIAVIVFSENYADSSWCLQELAHIMKCKDERGQIVIPIFYDIDPSELRKQKGKYGEALAKHESEGKNVESWRKALVDAGNLSGDVVNGPETIFIKGIVDTISERLCVAISSDDEDLIGMEARLQDLKSKLAIDSHDVLMVGIWGLGGGGKTTLASALYDEISAKFDGSCFVENIREESSKSDGLPKLQEIILSLVLKQKQMGVNRVEEGRRLIKSRLCRKKVLIVLDDVDHLDQLKALAGSLDWFGEGSRIIITTRDNHLLNAHHVNVMYNICLLNDDEAIKLFRKHAPQQNRPIKDHEMHSKKVVSYVGGLPLALKVLGSFLCDKDMSEWMSALARLKDIPESDIVERLKISYDGLKPMEKELFLDIACFFRGKEKDEAMVILDACGFHPIIGVKVLIQKALITVSEEGCFEMHDLIQEMGHYIVRGENPKNPELHSRIWQEEDVVKICGMDATKENVIEALPFERRRHMRLPHNLPYVVANMKKLRWISCYKYPRTSFSRNFQPMKLCYLQLQESWLEKLWKGNKYLPNLKVLDLSNSGNLIKTPDFGGLPCLERMVLRGCMRLKEIHPSIGYHERLIFLDMDWCHSLKVFPPIIRMKKLETLILLDCDNLRKFPEIETSMDNLVELSLGRSGIENLPASVGQYCTNLVYLDLRCCSNLESIEGNFHLLKHLKELSLWGCEELKNLQRGMLSMKLFGFSSSLRMLNLRWCNLVDGDISSDFCKELPNLQVLDLSGNNFSQLHSSLSQLPRLKYLNLSWCSNLVELPDLPSSIAVLIAEECESLDIVGDFPTDHLKYLWKVTLSASNSNGERILQSMLQGNAIEDYFISIQFDEACIPIRGFARKAFTLQLPWNWQSEFSGFLVYVENWPMFGGGVIIMKDVMGRENENDVLEISNEDEESVRAGAMCYISFGSLRHTSWWNSSHDTISFSLQRDSHFKVELVPKRSEVDSTERAKDKTNPLEFWDEESRNKTIEIIHESSSSVKILWSHCHLIENMFHFT